MRPGREAGSSPRTTPRMPLGPPGLEDPAGLPGWTQLAPTPDDLLLLLRPSRPPASSLWAYPAATLVSDVRNNGLWLLLRNRRPERRRTLP